MKYYAKLLTALTAASIIFLALTMTAAAFGASILATDGDSQPATDAAADQAAAPDASAPPATQQPMPEESVTDELFEEFASHDESYDAPAPGEASMPGLSNTADSLFMLWEKTGYPDDIGGVYYDSESGMMGFLLVRPTQERIDELRAMFDDEAIFTPCEYSYNELKLAQDEINAIIGEGSGIYSTGIGWTSTDRRVHGFGESGKEFRLVVGVDDSVFDHYSEGFAALYGDRVVVETGGPLMDDSVGIMSGGGSGLDGGMTEGGDSGMSGLITPIVPVDLSVALSGSAFSTAGSDAQVYGIWLWALKGAAALGTLLLVLRLRSRPVPAMQTANGGVVAGSASVSKKQAVDAVRNSGASPSEGLFDKISKKIDSQ